MLSYLLLTTILGLVVAYVFTTFPCVRPARVRVPQQRHEYPEDSRLPPRY
jgi:hypothetical protein